MARTGLAIDERFQRHITGAGHPERPERLERVAAALADRGLTESCTNVNVAPAKLDHVYRVHSPEYVARVRDACAGGEPFIDVPDSAICADSYDIALLASGSVINAVSDVMAGRLSNAFCAVRPPGHHAEYDRSMGFCLFNNIAIAARFLLEELAVPRVLVLDWDVHHGNGTQHSFEKEPRVLFISLHGHPEIVYPGTGYAHERGRGAGETYTINLPMLPPSGDAEYRRAFDETILPEADRFAPRFVLISAGFDAHRLDPLAPLQLETETFGWMTDELVAVARQHCDGRLVSVLEGGYDLDALADCVSLHVERLLEA